MSAAPTSLEEKLLTVHTALDAAGLEHAFGGAIALAFWTLDPRGTSDIDVNVFVTPSEAERVFAALPEGIDRDAESLADVERDGQVRLWWGSTPVDVFFSYERLHSEAADHRRTVPFCGVEIPILGPIELACFKAAFDRTKDWADIEAMLSARTLDPEAVRENLERMVGPDDPRLARLAEALRRTEATDGD